MKKQIISYLIEKGVLVSLDLVKILDDDYLRKKINELVINKASIKEILSTIPKKKEDITNKSSEKKDQEKNEEQINSIAKVEVLFDYDKEPLKKDVSHFVKYYNNRYKQIEKILVQRLENNISIARLTGKNDREQVSVIGMVMEKQLTKTNKVIVTLEDQTGTIKALFNPNNPDVFKQAKDIVCDETIGVTGTAMNGLLFAERIILPEMPVQAEMKKSPDESYAVFIADTHIGSNLFLEKQFSTFIEWLKIKYGDEEQKEIAKKVKYLFIVGDLVAGVGIYPKQEEELVIRDIYKQYDKFIHYIKQIPDDINIIITPGNHDGGRLAEPQPRIEKEFLKELYDKPNTFILSNPARVNIHSNKDFPGFDVLLYHGYSYDYYGDNVESIRMSGREISDRAEMISKFLLQRRHLAPTHQSTLSIPDIENDPLFIETQPDFFVTGHIHKSAISSYRGTTIICSSCWEAQTTFQEKFGHEPDLCKVVIVNLKTRKTKILDFENITVVNEKIKEEHKCKNSLPAQE